MGNQGLLTVTKPYWPGPKIEPLLGGGGVHAPFAISPLLPAPFNFPPFAPFSLFHCSFFIFLCSMVLFNFSSYSRMFFMSHTPFWNFPLLHAPFYHFGAPCTRIIICLLPAPLPILWLAPCSFESNRACSLLQDYP